MGYPAFQRARAFKSVVRTAGSAVVNTTSYVAVDGTGAFDLTLEAQAGDVLAVSLSGFWGNDTPQGKADACTMVGGSVVNYISGLGATGFGVPAWCGGGGVSQGIGAPHFYTVVAGDISNGLVTLRLFAKSENTTAKTLYAVATLPLQFNVRNLGPADPN